MNCGGDRGTIRVEIWHRLKDPVQTDRMGPPSGRLQGVEQEGEKTMGKIVIVGSGPAGCSAALYAARAGQEVVVISMGMGALSKAELIQNYYGFEEGITGAELYRAGLYRLAGGADHRRRLPGGCGDPGDRGGTHCP